MSERRLTTWARVAVAGGVLALGACSNLGAYLGGSKGGDDSDVIVMSVETHLAEIERLVSGTYQDKLDLFENIQADYYADPSDTNRLRYALAKGVNGHDFSNLNSAFSDLQAVIAAPGVLSGAQLALAQVSLRQVEDAIIMQAERDRLQADLAAFESRNTVNSNRVGARLDNARKRLDEAEKENQRLEEELERTRRQLEAVMSIETSPDRNNQ